MTRGSDTFATARAIAVGTITDATPTSGLSFALEPGEPTYSSASIVMSRSAWWKFTATRDAEVAVNLFQSEGVASWEDVSFTRLAVYTGTSLDALTLVDDGFGSGYLAEDLSYAPELLIPVTAGTTYRVQAMTRDSYPDFSYRLQVAEYADTVTDWVQEDDFDYAVPQIVDIEGDLIAEVGGGSKMFDALDPMSLSNYGNNPDLPLLQNTIHHVLGEARENPVNDAHSSESATLRAEVGDHPVIPGGGPFGADGVDTTRRRYGAAYREFTYAFRDYEALLSHRTLPYVIPEGGLDYEFEDTGGIDRSEMLEAHVGIHVRTFSEEEGNALGGGYTSPSGLTHMFVVLTGPADELLPPMPSVSNNSVATDMDGWEAENSNIGLTSRSLNQNGSQVDLVDMTDHINTDGTFVLTGRITQGSWAPPNITGYYVSARAWIKVQSVTYLARPPRRRWTVRTYLEGEPLSTPYRRIYPRDDGLSGGARRNYPPSRATQSSNRNVGGYL